MTDSVALSFETGENLTLRAVLRLDMGNSRTEVVRGGWRDSSEAAMRSLATDAGLRLRAVIKMYDTAKKDEAPSNTSRNPTKEEYDKLAAEAREVTRKNQELTRKNQEMRALLQRIYTAIISTGRLINEELGPRE